MNAILQTVEASGKSSLAEYVSTGGVLNFGGGNLNFSGMGGSKSFQVAKLIDMLDMTTKALGGIVHEILVQDVLSIEKIRSMLKKEVISGMKLNAKGEGVYINNVRLTGSQTDTQDSLGFRYQTKDLDINIVKNQGSVKLEIPGGISLKKSSKSSKNGMGYIQIKSSTFGKMMAITKARVLPGIWNRDVDIALANLFGSYDSKITFRYYIDHRIWNRTPYNVVFQSINTIKELNADVNNVANSEKATKLRKKLIKIE